MAVTLHWRCDEKDAAHHHHHSDADAGRGGGGRVGDKVRRYEAIAWATVIRFIHTYTHTQVQIAVKQTDAWPILCSTVLPRIAVIVVGPIEETSPASTRAGSGLRDGCHRERTAEKTKKKTQRK